MKKPALPLFALAVAFVLTASLHAQGPGGGGCVNSPENPTAVLAAVGSVGAFLFSRLKMRRSK